MMIKRLFSASFWVCQLSKNHLNVLLTLWFNFHFLPFKQAIKLPIFLYGKPRILKADGSIKIEAPVRTGMITINRMKSSTCSSGGDTEFFLHKNGLIIFKGSATIGCGCSFNINIGKFIIGEKVIINHQNNIGCFNRIEIGSETRIGHQNQIYDTNFHHLINLKTNMVKCSNAPIVIGHKCWITNRCTIMQGISLPDYTIVSSNSLVNKNVATDCNQIIGGIPAKMLKDNITRIWNASEEGKLHFFFRDNAKDILLNQAHEL